MRSRNTVSFVLLVMLAAAATGVCQDAGYFPQGVASGDPRPDSVVLWTRVQDPAFSEGAPLTVDLQVATDPGMTSVIREASLTAAPEHDHCVKVKVDRLDPDTVYYYRFQYRDHTSPVGRTKTAPNPGADRLVRFAVVYGQDYVGRYYNAYLKLLRDHPDDLDFVVHLGDYVYETTGDPSFQDPSAEHGVHFQDTEGAIALGDPDHPYYAASSLANYRTLYKTFRSDPVLQEVHRLYPMVVIWDDHEYSNDCHGATATYFNGRVDEDDPVRRRHAEQAFYEYVPTEIGLGQSGTLEIGDDVLYPNSGDFRDFTFGQHLHLVMTDYRTFRPDHLIPEDAFPGTIVLDEPALRQLLGDEEYQAAAGSLDPYLNVDLLGLSAMGGVNIFRQSLVLIASQAFLAENPGMDPMEALHRAQEVMHGNISLTYIGLLFQAAGLPQPFPPEVVAGMPRGISFLFMGKQKIYDSTGSRYLVLSDPFRLYAASRMLATGGAAENAFGAQQMAWLQGVLMAQPATWNVMASSVSMAPMVLDFSNPDLAPLLPPQFPDMFRTRLTINVDQWDGFPDMREGILSMLRSVPNPVVISGDIHGSFVVDHGGVYEFTGPAISSESLQEMVLNTAMANPLLAGVPGLDQLVQNLDLFLQVSALDDVHVSPSDIVASDTLSHGFLVVEAGPEALRGSLTLAPADTATTSYYDHPEALDGLYTTRTFEIHDGVLSPLPE